MKRAKSSKPAKVWWVQASLLVLADRRLTPTARLLYLVLLKFARSLDNGSPRQGASVHPGQETLSALLGVEVRQINNLLVELEDRGLIEIQRRGLRLTNLYWLLALEAVYNDADVNNLHERASAKNESAQMAAVSWIKAEAEGFKDRRRIAALVRKRDAAARKASGRQS